MNHDASLPTVTTGSLRAWSSPGLVACLLPLGCWTVILVAGCQVPAGMERTSRIAVVDSQRVFDGYAKSRARKEAFQHEASSYFDKIKEHVAELERLQTEVETYPEGSEERAERSRRMEELEARVEELRETDRQRLERMRETLVLEITDEIEGEIRQFASERNLDAVFETRIMFMGPRGTASQWRVVHYARPLLDITDRIVDRLNDRYRGGQEGSPAVEPPGETGD